MWDLKCLAAAACFLASNVLFVVHSALGMRGGGADARTANANDGAINQNIYGSDNSYDPAKEHSAVKPVGFQLQYWKDLDPAYIESRWADRESSRPLMMSGALLGAMAWFWLIVPIVQSAWVLSRGGRRKVGAHMALASFAICGGIIELLTRLMVVGMTNASEWMAKDFNLDDWDEGDVMGMGWRVLEMIHIVTRGMLLWIDAFEALALFGIVVVMHYSVATEPKFKVRHSNSLSQSSAAGPGHEDSAAAPAGPVLPHSPVAPSPPPPQAAFAAVTQRVPVKPTFSRCFTGFGLVVGALALADFVVDVLRFVDWRVFGRAAMATNVILGVLLLPLWLVLLSRQLPAATERFEREGRRAAIASDLGGEDEATLLKGEAREVS